MLDGSRWTNPATLDGSCWTNPAMLDGFSGRILSRLVVSAVQILPSRPGGSRWANPVGQSTLDEANGFHLRVRHCHFHECPLGKSTRITTSPSFTGHNPLQCLGFTGPSPPRVPIPKRPGHFSTRATIRCGAPAPKRQSCFSARHQSAQPVSTSRTKSTQAQNHQPKPPRESTEFISFFAQALWGLATTLSVAPHSATSPSSSTRSLSASPDTSAKS